MMFVHTRSVNESVRTEYYKWDAVRSIAVTNKSLYVTWKGLEDDEYLLVLYTTKEEAEANLDRLLKTSALPDDCVTDITPKESHNA